MRKVYKFDEFLTESENVRSAVQAATQKKFWVDVMKSDYFTENEKAWISDKLVENGVKDIDSIDESVWDAIKKGVDSVKDSAVGKAISDKIGKAMDGAKNFAAYVGDLLKKAWEKLLAYFKNKFKDFKDVIKKDYEKLKAKGGESIGTVKDEVDSLKKTTQFWSTELPTDLIKTITGKFTQEITKECLTYDGTNFINELASFDREAMDRILESAINEADEEAADKKGSFAFLNTMAHAIAKFPPFSILAKVKELGTSGAQVILKKFSEITKSLGGPGTYEFAILSMIAGSALELYLKHKAASIMDKGLEDVVAAEPVLKMIPMAKTIIHAIEMVALMILIIETVSELSGEESAH